MKIDIHNYEAFFLDYMEGNLDEAGVKELFVFLEKHPELKAELNAYEDVKLEPEPYDLEKISLKKTTFTNEDIIAYVEGLADEAKAAELELLSKQNKALATEVKLFKHTKLAVDYSEVFKGKSRLKKGGVVIYLQSNPVVWRAAAAILLLLGLFFLIAKLNTSSDKEDLKPVLAVENDKKSDAINNSNAKVVSPAYNQNKLVAANGNKKEIAPSTNNVRVKQLIKNDPPHKKESTLLAGHVPSPVNSNTLTLENKNYEEDSLLAISKSNVSPANTTTNTATYKSWYNYEVDRDDEDAKPALTASSVPVKKTFFQKVTNAAKTINAFGVKKVDAKEEGEKNSLMLGGLVVTETTSQ